MAARGPSHAGVELECRPARRAPRRRCSRSAAAGRGRNLARRPRRANTSCSSTSTASRAPTSSSRYAAVLTAHPGALACGPVRYLREGWVDRCADQRPTCPTRRAQRRARRPARACPAPRSCSSDDHELFWSLNFACQRDRRGERLGGFDAGYVGYGAEDTDLGLRAAELGIPLLWVAGAAATTSGTRRRASTRPASTRSSPTPAASAPAGAAGRWSAGSTSSRRPCHVRFDPDGDVLERVGR